MISNIKDAGMEIDTFLHNMPSIDFFAKYPDVIKKIREDYSNDNKPEQRKTGQYKSSSSVCVEKKQKRFGKTWKLVAII